MRHLKTDELLLYASGELEDRELRRHVAECVDCKADLVDLQESFVLAADAICEELPVPAPDREQLAKLRTRLAAEAQLLSLHLSTEDLLLSIEGGLSPESEAHLAACAPCQSRAADVQVQLASIEYELQRECAFELPLERQAKALAMLRASFERGVEAQPQPSPQIWGRLSQALAFAPRAAALAGMCLAAWLGWDAFSVPNVAEPVAVAQLTEPAGNAAVEAPRAVEVDGTVRAAQPEQFGWAAPRRSAPPGPPLMRAGTAPEIGFRPAESRSLLVALPGLESLPEPTALAQAARALEVPAAALPQAPPEVLAEGSWMLVKAGLWRANMQVGGTAQSIRFSGTVASEREREQAERALLAAAAGRPVEFDIAVRNAELAANSAPNDVTATRTRSLGTTVRSSLLKHYSDAARRSFLPLDRTMLENELDLYVSDVMRHDADLLAHVHALHDLLSRPGIDQARQADGFRRVARYHLDAIARNRAEIYGQLSEALPRRYWAYRGPRDIEGHDGDLRAAGKAMLEDALGLDQALSSLFFASAESLDLNAGSLSSASLLERLRLRTRQLRSAIR